MQQRFTIVALAATLSVAFLGGCGGDGGGGGETDTGTDTVDDSGGGDVADTGDTGLPDTEPDAGPDVDDLACLSTLGCQLEDGYDGMICVDGFCAPCTDAASCEADYGMGATCDGGLCTYGCFVGEAGCPCDDGACTESFCIDDACVDCAAGDIGCVCDTGDACEADAICGDDGLCVACEQGTSECLCNDDDTCEVGLRCGDDGLCETCPAGEETCPCDTGDVCDAGLLCMMDLCVVDSCVVGTSECPCDTDDACDADLYCGDDALCHTCDANALDCECTVADGCSGGFVCDAGDLTCRDELTCADDFADALGCVPNQQCDDGDDGEDATCLPSCETGFMWNGATCVVIVTLNCIDGDPDSILDDCAAEYRECVDMGGGAMCGDCLTGFTEDGMDCRALLTCPDISGTCTTQHRACVASDGIVDATCGACVAPYIDDAGSCVLSSDANCLDGDPDSILAMCQSEHRACVDPMDSSGADCGSCVSGYAEDAGVCRQRTSCVDLGCSALGRSCEGTAPFETCGDCQDGLFPLDPMDPLSACATGRSCADLDCADDEFCIESDSGGDATCVTNACGAGQATDPSTGMCVTCGITEADCDEVGHTGRLWPFSRDGGECVCETLPGYYFDTSSALIPRVCDADHDGWIVAGAQPFLEHSDDAVRDNARCNLRTIDRITLQNDLSQRFEILICADDDVAATEGSCTTPLPMDLYEPSVLDSDSGIAGSPGFFPVYQDNTATGRAFQAEELNPLTRACITPAGDFNNNGVADIREAHGADTSSFGLDPRERVFYDYSYYIELHRGWVEERPGQEFDTFVIAERSRCDGASGAAFPIEYADAGGSQYWRECIRNRDSDYDEDDPRPNYDFARWSCDVTTGSCPNVGPITEALPDASARIPVHSTCDAATPPADGIWRGMSHHSQFRCVEVDDDGAIDDWQLDMSLLYDAGTRPSGRYQFNDCRVDCSLGDADCATDCASGTCETTSEPGPFGANPASPVIVCDQELAADGDVGFVAVRYLDGPGYDEGCVDEAAYWPELCPGYLADPLATVRDGVDNDFGRLACGCGLQFGGASCEVGCPNVLVSPDYNPSPRDGWWMCGEVVETGMTMDDPTHGAAFVGTYDSSDWVMRSRVRTAPRALDELNGTDSSAREWSLR